MTEPRRPPSLLSLNHVIVRISLAVFVAALFLAALAFAIFERGDELALERTIANAVKSWLWP